VAHRIRLLGQYSSRVANMPKRSNSFQQLIYSIQHNISNDSVVNESEFLIDRQTNGEVEVDIVIETVVNDISLIISIEVRDRKRPATVEWIRECIGKHATLPTNKLVLVSSSGFTKAASKKAEENSIEALTIDEAQNYTWSKAAGDLSDSNMKLAVFNLSWIAYSVSYATSIEEEIEVSIDQESLNECIFSNALNGEKARLFDLAGALLKDGKIARPIMQQWIKEEKENFTITWNVPDGSIITDLNGKQYPMELIKVIGKCVVERESISFEFSRFKSSHVAHATVNDIVSKQRTGGEVTLAVIEQKGKEPLSTITLPKPDEFGRRVLTMINTKSE
jgi:Restriction endonuclease